MEFGWHRVGHVGEVEQWRPRVADIGRVNERLEPLVGDRFEPGPGRYLVNLGLDLIPAQVTVGHNCLAIENLARGDIFAINRTVPPHFGVPLHFPKSKRVLRRVQPRFLRFSKWPMLLNL